MPIAGQEARTGWSRPRLLAVYSGSRRAPGSSSSAPGQARRSPARGTGSAHCSGSQASGADTRVSARDERQPRATRPSLIHALARPAQLALILGEQWRTALELGVAAPRAAPARRGRGRGQESAAGGGAARAPARCRSPGSGSGGRAGTCCVDDRSLAKAGAPVVRQSATDSGGYQRSTAVEFRLEQAKLRFLKPWGHDVDHRLHGRLRPLDRTPVRGRAVRCPTGSRTRSLHPPGRDRSLPEHGLASVTRAGPASRSPATSPTPTARRPRGLRSDPRTHPHGRPCRCARCRPDRSGGRPRSRSPGLARGDGRLPAHGLRRR